MDRPLDTHRLLDAIAAITSRHESGRLQFTASGSRGAFFFLEGKLVAAHMGPLSGFAAVNLAVSMGEGNLNFDSSIQPAASTFTAINERVLLRERFGIETVDLEPVEDPTTEIEGLTLPVLITPQVVLPEDAGRKVEEEKSFDLASGIVEGEKPGGITGPAITLEPTTSEKAANARITTISEEEKPGGITGPAITLEPITSEKAANARITTISEEEKPGQTSGPALTLESSIIEMRKGAGTKRCPKCNRVYDDFRIYCRHDSAQLVSESDTSFNAAVKPEAATRPSLLWTLITITLVVGGILGYLLNSYFSRQPAAPASIGLGSEQNSNADEDQPVVEGPLHGKEITLMKPEYPAKAKSEGVSGKVTVAIFGNKQGRVVSARALTGQRMLKVAAVVAARQSKFSPEKLAAQRSRNSGTITYTFKL
jgi:TonB family protein